MSQQIPEDWLHENMHDIIANNEIVTGEVAMMNVDGFGADSSEITYFSMDATKLIRFTGIIYASGDQLEDYGPNGTTIELKVTGHGRVYHGHFEPEYETSIIGGGAFA